jgi:hypothetical protein
MYRYINKFKAVEEIDKEIELIKAGKNKRMDKVDKEYFMAGLNHAKLIVLGMEGESLRDFFIKKPEEEKFIEFKGYKAPEETTTDMLLKKHKKDLEEIKKRNKCYNCNFESFEECLKCSYDDSKRGFKDDK